MVLRPWKCGAWILTLLAMHSIAVNQDALCAQGNNLEEAEAKAFFQQVANQTRNPLIAHLALENLNQLQHRIGSTRQVIIPLMQQPDASLAVPLLINNKVMATFLVDTGSSYTVITPTLAQKLGVTITNDTPKVTLITANGTIEAPIVTLQNVSLGAVRVAEVNVVVQQLGNGDDPLLSGLLGMNFFKGMDLAWRDGQLVLGLHNPNP